MYGTSNNKKMIFRVDFTGIKFYIATITKRALVLNARAIGLCCTRPEPVIHRQHRPLGLPPPGFTRLGFFYGRQAC